MNSDYYTPKDVSEELPYRWSSNETWSSNKAGWEKRLRQFCALAYSD